ncbi:hypothetical protein ACPVTF_16060 [Geobacillus icigianus]|uniref:Uncharacterized protein n=1 Tax=Geobacillus subterraneus TaxID=129338 RepID=A0A679G0J0_9BACL|nr:MULTISPECIES: hypothetical protein [Geobacillus]BBW98614.1 hypothetical protein GsuE55_34470 [Geobacillus subterraneus]
MALQSVIQQIFCLMNKDWSKYNNDERNNMSKNLDELSVLLMSEIDRAISIESLESAIKFENEHYFLPIPCVIKLYQKLILLNHTNKPYYEGLVDYLLLYGPDWEEEANKITNLIEKERFETARDYVQSISYYKEFNNCR